MLLTLLLACADPPPAITGVPHIVFITLDTTRADHLGCYGYFRDTSPNLDKLADEGILFERALAPMATTLPSHLSMLTATTPIEHGVLANLKHGGKQFVPSEQLTTFTQYAKSIGYDTAAFVSAAPVSKGMGVDDGFDHWGDVTGHDRRARETTNEALDWLDGRSPERPLFLWLHYFDPHGAYDPPPPFDQTFAIDRQLRRWLWDRDIDRRSKRPTGKKVKSRNAHNDYDGEILYLDKHLGRVFSRLKDDGYYDDAVIIVVGDHGEGLGQHQEPGHGKVWNEQLQVPMIVRVPGQQRRRVTELVSIVDLFPTVLGMIDLPEEERWLAQSSGVNVLAGDFEERPVLSLSSERQAQLGEGSNKALTWGQWKYIEDTDAGGLLYDLVADPFELASVAADQPAKMQEMSELLAEIVATQEGRAVELGSGETREMSPSQIEMLEKLGYVLDDGAGEEE